MVDVHVGTNLKDMELNVIGYMFSIYPEPFDSKHKKIFKQEFDIKDAYISQIGSTLEGISVISKDKGGFMFSNKLFTAIASKLKTYIENGIVTLEFKYNIE